MAQSAAAWRGEGAATFGRMPRGRSDLPWTIDRVPAVRQDGAGLLGVISDAAQQVRVHSGRADAAEARLAETEAQLRQAETDARDRGRRLLDMQLRAEAAERRADEIERHLKRAGFAVLEAEARLERALAEAKAERERAGEIQRSSSDAVERMRALLNATGDRLRHATRDG